MKTTLDKVMMGLGIFAALLLIGISFSVLISVGKNKTNHEIANDYCRLKGYDDSNSGKWIKEQFKEFKGEKYVWCYKDLVKVDDEGKATFQTVIDWVIYDP